MTHQSLTSLPLEVLYSILIHLDIPSLLQTSRTSWLLRTLSLDPLVQKARLLRTRHDLNILLRYRSSKAAISPPNAWIYLSKTNVLSRSISKSLIKIRLSHSLERRPSIEELVARAILPAGCARPVPGLVSAVIVGRQEEVRKSRLKDRLERLIGGRPSIDRVVELNIMPVECAAGSRFSPSLVETRRMVVKENLKDGLRAWVKGKAIKEQRRKEEEYDSYPGRINVKLIVRKFTARKIAAELHEGSNRGNMARRRSQVCWGRELEAQRRREQKRAATVGAYSQPERAHVLSLKRFWEEVTKPTVS